MNRELDREALRERMQVLSDVGQRLVLERVVERLPDATLELLLDGLVRLDARDPASPPPPTPIQRVEAHIAATRRGAFLGEYVIRNKHGQREPWQTAAWVAATSHLFEVTFARIGAAREQATLASLRSLVELVAEVDERVEEFVVFEDSSASDQFWSDLERARRVFEAPGLEQREA